MRLKYFFLLLVVYPTAFCFGEEISFESNVSYKKNDQADFTQAKDGDKIHLERGENIFVITKNMPLFILAPTKSEAIITIPDASINSAIFEQVRPSIEKNTSEIIDGIRKTESLIQKRDYNQASQIIINLKQKYRNISSILFMSATVRYLLNDKSAATEDLEKGLEIDPTNESAKKLLSKLKGGA
jgi:hypothetical protein